MNDFVIRWATEADKSSIIEMMKSAFRGVDEFAEMSQFFMSPLHASGRPETTCIAVEAATGRVAAAVNAAPMTWRYEGIPLKVLNYLEVGTHPDFREHGVMKLVMNEIHSWAAENEYDITYVGGIPWYYRQHGYLPMPLNAPFRTYARHGLPNGHENLKKLIIRPFEEKDIPFAVEVLASRSEDRLFTFTYDEVWVRMFALDYFESNKEPSVIITDKQNNPLGVIVHHTKECNGTMSVIEYALKPGISHLEITPGVVQYLIDEGDRQMSKEGGCTSVSLPYDHGTEEIFKNCMSRQERVGHHQCRLTDIQKFLMKLAPVLEDRIAKSVITGYTRTINIQLYGYSHGLTVQFEKGKVVNVHRKEIDYAHSAYEQYGDIQIPYEKMMLLIFGVECIDDILNEYREVNSWDGNGLDNEMRILLKILFPKRRSHILHAC